MNGEEGHVLLIPRYRAAPRLDLEGSPLERRPPVFPPHLLQKRTGASGIGLETKRPEAPHSPEGMGGGRLLASSPGPSFLRRRGFLTQGTRDKSRRRCCTCRQFQEMTTVHSGGKIKFEKTLLSPFVNHASNELTKPRREADSSAPYPLRHQGRRSPEFEYRIDRGRRTPLGRQIPVEEIPVHHAIVALGLQKGHRHGTRDWAVVT